MTTNKPKIVCWGSFYSGVMQDFGYSEEATKAAANLDFSGYEISIEPLVRLSDYEALQAECDALRDKTRLTLGVGDGTGNLFVHGDYDSIKRVQELIFECEKLRKDTSE